MARYWSDGYKETDTVGQAAPYEVTMVDVERWNAKQDPLFFDEHATIGSENLLKSGIIALEFQELRQYVQEEGGKAIYIEILVDSVTKEYDYKSDNFEKVVAAFEKGKTVILHVLDTNEYAYLQTATKDYFKFILFGKNDVNAFQVFHLYSNGLITNYFVNIPVLYEWALQERKPAYTYSEVGAEREGVARTLIQSHDVSENTHADIRELITGLTTRLNTLMDSDDITLDQLSEIVAYIKSNRTIIEEVTNKKINVTDIVDNLSTSVANKPLSARQGVMLKQLIDSIELTGKDYTSEGAYSFATNDTVVATGSYSFASGRENMASGNHSYTEGRGNTASGSAAHAEGYLTQSSGTASHTEGTGTIASKTSTHAEGHYTIASSLHQHVQGKYNIADTENKYAHIVGGGTKEDVLNEDGSIKTQNRKNIHTVDWDGNAWYAGGVTAAHISLGRKNGTDIGLYSTALGNKTTASGNNSYAEGRESTAKGYAAHAEGYKGMARGYAAHVEGYINTTKGYASHAEGGQVIVSGAYAHGEGSNNEVSGQTSHVEGIWNDVEGKVSHVEGEMNEVAGSTNHVEGSHNKVQSTFQHVQGKYSITDTNNTYAHIVGNGNYITPSNNYSNAHTLDWQGNAWYQGSVTSNGADYAEYFEWLDGNPNNEDRVGLLVTLEGDKIRLANMDDEVLGIISGTAAVLGDNYECTWNSKYLTDAFGRIIYDMVEEFVEIPHAEADDDGNVTESIETVSCGYFKHPRINPDYDPEQEYVKRSDRPEWDAVGMLGKLYVCDDGTCQVNGYVTVGENGIATASLEKTNMRVLSRTAENVVRVLLK